MEQEMDVLSVKDSRKFEVHCRAGDAGELCVGAESVSVKVGQRLRREGGQEIWHSVGVYAKTALSLFKFWFSIPIGMKRCKSPASSRGRVMEVVTRL